MNSAEHFVRGNDRLNRALQDPGTQTRVAAIREDMDQADREYQVNLASIRSAANLTQAELADRMGLKQAAVSAVEHRDDLLLSTLANYLRATGATDPRIVVTTGGHDIEYPLPMQRPQR
jgi:DNA-binding XRE family transcriptional regulator